MCLSVHTDVHIYVKEIGFMQILQYTFYLNVELERSWICLLECLTSNLSFCCKNLRFSILNFFIGYFLKKMKNAIKHF